MRHAIVGCIVLAMAFGAPTRGAEPAAAAPACTAHEAAPPDANADADADPDADSARLDRLLHGFEDDVRSRLAVSLDPRDRALGVYVGAHTPATATLGAPTSSAIMASRVAQLMRALDATPTDPLVLWAAVGVLHDDDVRLAPVLARLEALESDNGAVWLHAIALAKRSDDSAAGHMAFARFAASQRYEEHLTDLMRAEADAFHATPVSAELAAEFAMRMPTSSLDATLTQRSMSRGVSLLLPPYKNLLDLCPVQADAQSERARGCEAIGRRMAFEGTTLIANRIGAVVLRHSRRFDVQDVEQVREQEWIQQQIGLGRDSLDDRATYSFGLWLVSGNELGAYRTAVLHAGGSLQPPPGWEYSGALFSHARLAEDEAALRAATGSPDRAPATTH